MTVDITDRYVIRADETIHASGIAFQFSPSGADDPALINQGLVKVTDGGGGFIMGLDASTGETPSGQLWNRAGASFIVEASGAEVNATGFRVAFADGHVVNDGLLLVAAEHGQAVAGTATGGRLINHGQVVVRGGLTDDGLTGGSGLAVDDGQLINTGTVSVDGWQASGAGVSDGDFRNTGRISAHSHGGDAYGVGVGNIGKFLNAGEIIAMADAPGAVGVGLSVQSDLTSERDLIVNTGLIRGSAFSIRADTGNANTVRNHGALIGEVYLAGGQDQLLNDGRIAGKVDLSFDNDLYDGRGGRLEGTLLGGFGDDLLRGGGEAEVIYGDTGDSRSNQGDDDTLLGGGGGDALSGEAGDDELHGGFGADTLTGGLGRDVMSGDGQADLFVFTAVLESGHGQADLIRGLDADDRIDLSGVDADHTQDGNQAFVLVAAFDGHAGELALRYDAGAHTTVLEGDVDGDQSADLVVKLQGDHRDFTSFVL